MAGFLVATVPREDPFRWGISVLLVGLFGRLWQAVSRGILTWEGELCETDRIFGFQLAVPLVQAFFHRGIQPGQRKCLLCLHARLVTL